ncbi:hypothetical protein GE061_003335 [Apolygus lucorum]|uniref:Uncharacterized protein n=1 Tax=Apolygus lucorum TaxID=248454 RepID=A0A6A4JT32_APOLU|nr:hypothetical protein GE061_003335 [Apolygus lucorum]
MSCEGPVNVSTSSTASTLEEKVDTHLPATILELVGEPIIASDASEIAETAEISFVTPGDLKAGEISNAVELPNAVLVEGQPLVVVETPVGEETVDGEQFLLVEEVEPPRVGEPPTAVEPSVSEIPAAEAEEPLELVEAEEPPTPAVLLVSDESPKIYETLKPAEPQVVADTLKSTTVVTPVLPKVVESPLKATWTSKMPEPQKPPRCISRAPRKAPYTSSLITQSDIAQEILARAEKKRQTFPDAVDVLVAMKSPSQIRIPALVNPVPHTSPPKLPKLRDENKLLDAKDLLLILQDGADGSDQKTKTSKNRNPRPKLDLKIDPDLERELALKQLMEFSKKTERKPRNSSNNNVEGEQVKKGRPAKQDKPPVKSLKKDKNPKGVVKTIKPIKKQLKINRMLKTNRQEKDSKPVKNNKQEKGGKQEKSPVKQDKPAVKQEKSIKIKQEKDIKQEKVEAKDSSPVKPKKRAGSASASNGPPAKRSNRELARLLQDEGAINMLYDIEKGNTPENKSRLSSKTRLKKVLKKKAQDVKEAILAATSTSGSHRSMRTSEKRKQSVDSIGQESSAEDQHQEAIPPTEPLPTFQETFQQSAEASKIIRRHSSSSSYSSRGSSPRRMSVDRDRSPSSSSETTPSKIDLLNLTATLAELHQESPSTEFLPQSAQASEFLPQSSLDVDDEPVNRSSPHTAVTKATTISERTEKLIEMKVRELNLQPHHGAIIKRLIVDKKNGLKERLQSEFAVKFKAALPHDNHTESTLKAPGVKLNMQALQLLKAKTKNLVSNMDTPPPTTTSPSKPVWKSLVEEDWDSGDEDVDDPAPSKSIKIEEDQGLSKTMEQDISIIAENMLARLKAGEPISQLGSLLNRSSTKAGTTKSVNTSVNSKRAAPVEAAEIRLLRASSPPTESQIEELTNIPQSVEGPVPGSDVRLERMNAIIRLYIKPTTCRLPNSLNVKVLNELTQALTYLESSSDIRVIVLVFPPLHEAMSAISDSENDATNYGDQAPHVCAGRISPAFRSGQNIVEVLPTDQVNHCNGIDLLSLCAESQDERRHAATQTATAIKDLTHKLATCSRLVCTAVSGKAIGLSVVLLAYCDFVLADETASFSTPYTQLGYLPEAAATHTLPHIIGRRKTSWLLLGNGTLTASEAEVCGLVTRVVSRRCHLAHELNTLARSLASTSLLASESAKGMMYHSIRSTISNLLSTEAKVLETHWSAPDTQHRMKNFAVQLILDMHKAQWKERESRGKEAEVEIIRSQVASGQEVFEVPSQQLVFEEPSDHLGIEPLQPVDELHFEDPTVELQMPSGDHEYELQQLR